MASPDALSRLRSQLDGYLGEIAEWKARAGSGREVDEPLGAVRARARAFADPELFQSVTEAATAAQTDPEESRRLRALRAFLAEELLLRRSQDAEEEVRTFERKAQVQLGEETLSFHAALARMPHELQRPRRALLEAAVAKLLMDQTTPYARRVEAEVRCADALGFPGPRALFEQTTGIALGPLVEQAEATLRRTEDAYQDVFRYFLRKLDATLKPLPGSGARRHDLLHLATGAVQGEYFRPEELWPAVAGTAEQLEMPLDLQHHVRVEREARPGMRAQPFAAEVKVPDSIWLVLPRVHGLSGAAAMLRATGMALQAAHRNRMGTVEDRRLGDRSVALGFATVFERLVTEERFLRRAFSFPAPLARDVARLAAFSALTELRSACALLPYELSLMERGAQSELSDEYEERQRHALLVPVPRGFFLFDHRPFFDVARRLRGTALEASLAERMRERFDVDAFRNPEAGRFLKGLFAMGARDDAAALAETLGAPLELTRAGDRLVRVLNA